MQPIFVLSALTACMLAALIILPLAAPSGAFMLRNDAAGGCLAVGPCDAARATCSVVIAPCNTGDATQVWRPTWRGLECPARRVVLEGHHTGPAHAAHVAAHPARASTVLLPGVGSDVRIWYTPEVDARAAAHASDPVQTGAFLAAHHTGSSSLHWSHSRKPGAQHGATAFTLLTHH